MHLTLSRRVRLPTTIARAGHRGWQTEKALAGIVGKRLTYQTTEVFQKAFDRVTQKIGPSCARLAESDAEWHAQAAAAAAEYYDMEREAEANGGADAMTRALIAAGRKSLAMVPPSREITPAMIEAGAYEYALEHMGDEPVTVLLADRLIAENIIRAALEAK
jgi:hypothetical protein